MTTDSQVFLKPETKLVPLAGGWYAWIHLICPAQRALNVAYRHIPLLQSFVKNSAVHVSASQDPTLYAGPFVHLRHEQVTEARHLLEQTLAAGAGLLRFARDWRRLDEELQSTAHGYSLSAFYGRLSPSLAGLVELLYDTNNHPRVRLYEELLYDEALWADSYAIRLSLLSERERPFFMSTPLLQSADSIEFSMTLADARVDLLAAMRTQPASLADTACALGVTAAQRPLFDSFFTTVSPARTAYRYDGNGVRVRYFGHACVLVQTARTAVLIDPMFAWETNDKDGRFTFVDLPDHIDYVILTHAHQDHCSPEMLIQLRHRIGRVIVPGNNSGSITDPSMKLALRFLGIERVTVLEAFDAVEFAEGAITSLPFPGEHVDLDIHSRHGIHLDISGRKFAFLVDSEGLDPVLFRHIARRVGNLDALFMGMECYGAPLSWLYGPLLTKPLSRRDDDSRRLSGLDGARAWQVLQALNSPRVFVYGMGQEPWLRHIMGPEYAPESVQLTEIRALLERCRQAGIQADSLFISHQVEF